MTFQQILEYEIMSMTFLQSVWYNIFPKAIARKVNRKILRYNESVAQYNKLKGEETLTKSRYPLKESIRAAQYDAPRMDNPNDEYIPYWRKDDFPTQDNKS